MKIGEFDTDEKVLIIAEIGNNHEGSFEVAKNMVSEAAQCGVDAVKFQTFQTGHYVSNKNQERFDRLKSFELTYDQFRALSDHAREQGVLFISTPFDLLSVKHLEPIVDALKIASGDNTFYPLIDRVIECEKPTILSLGLLGIEGIRATYEFIAKKWSADQLKENLALLHCVCSYPVPVDEANLLSILVLGESFPGTIGYSDHTEGMDASVLSVALGARIIEKHFTLDHNYSDFRDHQLSADPREMAEVVTKVRNAEKLLGSKQKKQEVCEQAIEGAVRRSIAINKDLASGSVVSWEDLTWIRPGEGFAPGEENLVVGKALTQDVKTGEIITMELLR